MHETLPLGNSGIQPSRLVNSCFLCPPPPCAYVPVRSSPLSAVPNPTPLPIVPRSHSARRPAGVIASPLRSNRPFHHPGSLVFPVERAGGPARQPSLGSARPPPGLFTRRGGDSHAGDVAGCRDVFLAPWTSAGSHRPSCGAFPWRRGLFWRRRGGPTPPYF